MKEQRIWTESDFPNHDVSPKSLKMMLRVENAELVNILRLECSNGQTEQIIVVEKRV